MIISIITMWEMLAISTYRQDPNVYCFFFVIAVVAFIKVIFDVTEKRDISKAQFNWNIIKTVFFTWIFISFLLSLTYVNNDKVIGLTKKTYQIEQMQEMKNFKTKDGMIKFKDSINTKGKAKEKNILVVFYNADGTPNQHASYVK